MRAIINIRIPTEYIVQAGEAATAEHRSRNNWIEQAIREKLEKTAREAKREKA